MKNKLRHITFTILVASALALHAEKPDSQADLVKRAKVSEATARATALAHVPNATVKASELEEEDGSLIWTYDLATPGTKDITEVHVDAISGKVTKTEVEGAKNEKEEKDAEMKEEKEKK